VVVGDTTYKVVDGYIKTPIVVSDTVYAGRLGEKITVGKDLYTIMDGGANNMTGGSDGQPITASDLILAVRKIKDGERYPYFFLADSGFTLAPYRTELIAIAKERVTTLAFLSAKLQAEYASDVVGAVSDDFVSLYYTGDEFTFSTDWFYMTNPYTGRENIPMPPSLSDLLVESNAISTDGMWTASAGWRKGKYFSQGLVRPKGLAEREVLYKRGINASKSKRFKGISKFSDLTGLNQERPLQYKSIKKLSMYIVFALQNYIEDIHFEDYDKNQIADLTGDIEAFLGYIMGAGGVYNFEVVIGDLVNDTTVSIRKLPIYVAITGKQFIQGVSLGLDIQQGVKTSVNLAYAKQLTA